MTRVARHVRLRLDSVHDRWGMLAPEWMFVLDKIAAEIMQRLDGARELPPLPQNYARASTHYPT